jgi:3-hydroxyisobutyrate dehydrogenase-like beta-hydroxyacid dehydrogenase
MENGRYAEKPRIGFIGIGVMGAPMASHISKAGYSLTLHDINRANAELVAAEHERVVVVDTPAEIAEASDIVITMLPSGKYVHEVTIGDRGLIKGFRPGALLLDTSSSEPWLTVEVANILANKGVIWLMPPFPAPVPVLNPRNWFSWSGVKKNMFRAYYPCLISWAKRCFISARSGPDTQ